MKNRRDVIRKKLEKRRKQLPQAQGSMNKKRTFIASDEERHGIPNFYDLDYEDDGKLGHHPLLRRDFFLFQVLAALCLFLIVGIMFKSSSPQWETGKSVVYDVFEKEFQFAMVADWYEEKFGKPLAILPVMDERNASTVSSQESNIKVPYAMPASGRVMEGFERNGKGITIQTSVGSKVEAIDEGFIVFAGIKEELGKTIVLQHSDGSETWYGNLEKIDVKLYDFVKARSHLGQVGNMEDGKSGQFYFAYKKGDAFIDPTQVIPVE